MWTNKLENRLVIPVMASLKRDYSLLVEYFLHSICPVTSDAYGSSPSACFSWKCCGVFKGSKNLPDYI